MEHKEFHAGRIVTAGMPHYVTLGRYDVVEIFEAPDDETAAEILMKLQRHGAEHTETLRAFTRDEAEAIVRRL